MSSTSDFAALGSNVDWRAVKKAAAAFQTPTVARSLGQFASTLLLYLGVNAAMYAVLSVSVWLTLLLSIPAAGLVVRLFIVQHDCGHGAFFRSRQANDALGQICSLFTFTPYALWRRQHNEHHGAFNNLDRRGSGLDLYSTCATLREYEAFSPVQKQIYRLSRHPIVSQLLLPPFIFLILYRVPFDTRSPFSREGLGVMATSAAIFAALGLLSIPFGWGPVLMVQGTIIALAAIIGAWLFCVQHRFEAAEWAREDRWSPLQAAVSGSSYLQLPPVLQWFTGNIGFHHIHHLTAKVPNYRLQACHEASPELRGVTPLRMREAFTAPFFALFDEDLGRMVRFPSR